MEDYTRKIPKRHGPIEINRSTTESPRKSWDMLSEENNAE
jgi:hypothetical protein